METKPDGRLYSKVLRRSVAIFQYISPSRVFTIREIAEEIFANNVPEFYLNNLHRTVMPQRIAAYLRYLVEINAFSKENEKYKLAFSPRTLDKDWVIVFSDLAWLYLSLKTKTNSDGFVTKFKNALKTFHKDLVLPMIPDIIEEFEIESGQKEEYFRWALYMFTDAESCPFDIRHYPVVVEKVK